jgi:hypothetical protein
MQLHLNLWLYCSGYKTDTLRNVATRSYHLHFESPKHPHVVGCFGQPRSTWPPCIQFNQIGLILPLVRSKWMLHWAYITHWIPIKYTARVPHPSLLDSAVAVAAPGPTCRRRCTHCRGSRSLTTGFLHLANSRPPLISPCQTFWWKPLPWHGKAKAINKKTRRPLSLTDYIQICTGNQ